MKYVLLVTVYLATLYGYLIYIKTKDILNPIFAFSAPILISVLVNLIFFDAKGYNISPDTYGIYFLGVVSFVIGCLFTYQPVRVKTQINNIPVYYNRITLEVFKIIAVFGTFVSVIYIVRAAASGYFGNNYIRNIRFYSLYVQGNNLIGKYSVIFIEVLFCIYAYKVFVLKECTRSNRRWLAITIIEYLIAIATSMARTAILQFILEFVFLILYGMKSNNRKKRTLNLKIVVLGLVGIITMQFLADKTEKVSFIDEVSGEPINWLIPYFGKEFYVFDKYIRGNNWVTRGINSLGFLGRVFQRLGLLQYKHSIDIPGGQVSSFISGPYTDFGILGVIIAMVIYGMTIGYIYRQMHRWSGWWAIFYGVCIYSCVISFYAFQFMMSSHLYVFVLIVILNINRDACIRMRRTSGCCNGGDKIEIREY